ncbi:MAG: hypothetical protein MJE77_21890 [Proteobacteria bacterium]|nr:hypothetical protein [Pseudomonadota bacterium]
MSSEALFIGLGILVFIAFGVLMMFMRFFRKVVQGQALIINKMKGEPVVTFSGGIVLPVFHRAEYMDISVKTIEIDRRGKDGLICRDNIRADIKVTFFVKVNNKSDDVLRVARAIGCVRASDHNTIEELFAAKFSEALKTAGKQLDFEQLYTQREEFRDEILKVIGTDLNGYVLEDAAIDYLEQTPLEMLDPDNILDAQGRRKIIELTAVANVRSNELKQKERMDIGAQNLNAKEALLNFARAEAEAEAKKDKEVSIAQAREQNEAHRVTYEEKKQTELKRQRVEEEIKLAEEAKLRAIAVAEQARLREVGVEQVRVAKATDLEEVDRQREVSLRNIDKEKQVEIEKKEIADVVRARVAVDKTVAVEEESIKDLRASAEAKRTKEVTIVAAEAEAQEILIKDIKKAEAQEQVAKLEAKKQLTLAEASLEASDKEARAKIRMSEGIQAEQAAQGLAEVRVKEADALAIEKQGLAEVKVREAAVVITEREGLVDAQIIKEKHLAEAAGDEQRGMAQMRVREAEAGAIEKKGLAEAAAVREKLLAEVTAKEAEAQAVEKNMTAEATGLLKKAEAMKQLDGETRAHEEFRLRLEKQLEFALESLKARVDIADKQAAVLASALDNAKINIVGGDGQFFDRFIHAVSVGKSLDGMVQSSDTVRGVLGDRLDGSGALIEDVKQMIAGSSSESIKNLSVAALLGRIMVDADDSTKSKLKTLIDRAHELGLSE